MNGKAHKHLVVQYLEKIRSEIFEEYRKEIKKFAKGRNGIYALYSGNKLYYVGLASSLTGRINNHLRDRHKGEWDTFSMYLTADSNYLKEIGKRLAMATRKIKENQTELIRYGLGSTRIIANYKGRTYKARIDRNGWVLYKGKKFPSLSAASIHILKRTCNGWVFWHAKNAAGKWTRLDDWR